MNIRILRTSWAIGVCALLAIVICLYCRPTVSLPRPVTQCDSDSTAGALSIDSTEPGTVSSRRVIDIGLPTAELGEVGVGHGKLELVALAQHGNQPIAMLCGEIICFVESDPWKRARSFETDSQGMAVVSDLPAGNIEIRLCNGMSAESAIRAGNTTHLEIRESNVVAISGIVLDADGHPSSDAEIWITGHGNSTLRKRVARGDSAGRFSLRHIPGPRSLAAIDRHHVKSRLVEISAPAGDSQTVVLRFPPGIPATLRGLIEVSGGNESLSSFIRLSPRGSASDHSSSVFGNAENSPIQLQNVGRAFEVVGLPASDYVLVVEVPGRPSVVQAISLSAGETQTCVVVVSDGNTLNGIVLDAQTRAPVEGAYISLGVEDSTGVESAATCYSAFSSVGGQFSLAGIPSGRVRVFAEHARLGQARTSLVVKPGERCELELLLSRGSEIVGRLVCEDRARFKSVRVGCVQVGRPGLGCDLIVDPDEMGEFRLRNCQAMEYFIDVLATNCAGPARVSRVGPVVPDGEPLLIDLRPESFPSAWLVGKVTDEMGRPLEGAILLVGDAKTKSKIPLDSRAVNFRVGPLLPGEVEIDAACQGYPVKIVATVGLAANQVIDLGVITMQRAVELRLLVRGLPDSTLSSLSGLLLDERGRVSRQCARLSPVVEWGALSSGTYQLECRAAGVVIHSQPLTVGASINSDVIVDLAGKLR